VVNPEKGFCPFARKTEQGKLSLSKEKTEKKKNT
jgi:hypothetical protein